MTRRMNDQPSEGETPASADPPTSTRRDVLARGTMFLSAAMIAGPLAAGSASAEGGAAASDTQGHAPPDQSLYARLGGIFAIAAVVDHFSDAIIRDPVAGARSRNPALRQWHTRQLGRLPGLKFMRTLWVASVAGGPFQFAPTRPGRTNLGLEEAHRNLRISPTEFDAVAAVLTR